MKKKLFTVFMLVAVVCIAAVGIAACEEGDWLEGTYVYSSCTVVAEGSLVDDSLSAGFDMNKMMKDMMDETYSGATMTFNKDEVTVSMAGVTSTGKYKMDGDTVIFAEGDFNMGDLASASFDIVVEGDTLHYGMDMEMAGVTYKCELMFVKQA